MKLSLALSALLIWSAPAAFARRSDRDYNEHISNRYNDHERRSNSTVNVVQPIGAKDKSKDGGQSKSTKDAKKNSDNGASPSRGKDDESKVPTQLDSSNFGQSQSIGAAIQLNSSSAGRSASLGAVKCAQGANESLVEAGGGAEAISECQAYFQAANAMSEHEKKLGGSGALQPDQSVLGNPTSDDVLSKFEKNFEMNRQDYLGRMMSGQGGRSVIGDILSSRVPEDSLAATFAKADELAEDASAKMAGASQLAAKGKGTGSSLRDKLSSRLDGESSSSKGRSLASAVVPSSLQAETIPEQNLTPLDPAVAFGVSSTKEVVEELSIFDVIRRKYKEVAAKFR